MIKAVNPGGITTADVAEICFITIAFFICVKTHLKWMNPKRELAVASYAQLDCYTCQQ